MELVFVLLVVLVGLAALDAAAVEVGVDSRTGSDDPHAPFFGAH